MEWVVLVVVLAIIFAVTRLEIRLSETRRRVEDLERRLATGTLPGPPPVVEEPSR